MPSHMSQDFPDYNWQKPKSYALKQKDYLLENDKRGSKTPKDKLVIGAKAKTVPPTWRTKTKNLSTALFLSKSLSLSKLYHVFF